MADIFGGIINEAADELRRSLGGAFSELGNLGLKGVGAIDYRGLGQSQPSQPVVPPTPQGGLGVGFHNPSDPFAGILRPQVPALDFTRQMGGPIDFTRQMGGAIDFTRPQADTSIFPQAPGLTDPSFFQQMFERGQQAQQHIYDAMHPQAQPTSGTGNWQGGDASKASSGLSGTQAWDGMIRKAAAEAGIPWQVIAAIMGIESGGQNLSANSAGAVGLMQVVPQYWQDLANQFGGSLSDPWTNIRTGAEILKQNYQRYGSWEGAAAAYLGAVDANGNPTNASDGNMTGIQYVQAFDNNLAALGFGGSGSDSFSQGGGGSNPRLNTVIQAAKTTVGAPYVWGGESWSEGGFDCSGLVQYAYAQAGIALPRTAQDQWNATQRIDRNQLQNGDLVFYKDTYPSPNPITHVGIYMDGKVLNAPDVGESVHFIDLDDPWWSAHLAGYGRVPMGGDLTMAHVGIDAPAARGAVVNAVKPGVVIGVGSDPRLGRYVALYDGGYTYTYGHLDPKNIHVREGDLVDKNRPIGRIGATGLETGPHVHLEVHDLAGNPVNAWTVL